jgi:hypothetical protein
VKIAVAIVHTFVIHVVNTIHTARITSQTGKNHGVKVALRMFITVMIVMNGTLTGAIVALMLWMMRVIASFMITVTALMLSSTQLTKKNAYSLG